MNGVHDAVEPLVHFLCTPTDVHGVLAHLQAGGGDTTCIHGLAGSKDHLGLDEGVDSLGRATHVADFAHALHAVLNELLGILAVELVLGGTGQSDVALLLPRFATGEERSFGKFLGIGSTDVITAGTEFEHIIYLLATDALGVVDVAVGTADGDDLGTQLGGLRGGTPGDVAETGDGHGLSLDLLAVGVQHLVDEVEPSEARSLGAHQRAAIFQALAGEHTAPVTRQLLVLAEEVANLAGTHSDITCGDVHFRTDVAEELAHEGLAETHDFGIALATGTEVRATLAAAHRQGRQGILESLLEAQELQYREIHAGVETQASLVGADGGVELHAVAQVHLHLTLIVHPGYTEGDDAFGLHQTFN